MRKDVLVGNFKKIIPWNAEQIGYIYVYKLEASQIIIVLCIRFIHFHKRCWRLDSGLDAIITYCIMLLHEDVRTFVPTVRCIDSGRMIQSSSNVILWSPHAHIVCLSQQCVMCVVWVSFSISESLYRIFRTSLTTSMCKSLKCLTSINIQSVVS